MQQYISLLSNKNFTHSHFTRLSTHHTLQMNLHDFSYFATASTLNITSQHEAHLTLHKTILKMMRCRFCQNSQSIVEFPRAVLMHIRGVSQVFVSRGNMDVLAPKHRLSNIERRLRRPQKSKNFIYFFKLTNRVIFFSTIHFHLTWYIATDWHMLSTFNR